MKKNIFIDLTALLDIIFIILFAVMLNINSNSIHTVEQLKETQSNMQLTRIESEKLRNEVQQQQSQIEQLNNQILEADSTYKVKYNNMETITKSLSKWLSLSMKNLEDIINQTNAETSQDLVKLVDELANQNAIIETLYKYEVIANKFVFIDLTILTEESKLYINDQDTGIFLSSEEWYDLSLRDGKITQVATVIEDYIESIEGGYSFILISFEHEDDIKHYSVNIILNAIDFVQSQYKDDRILETEYIIH